MSDEMNKNLVPEDEAAQEIADAAAQEPAQDVVIETENPKLEENDNWQFDGEAHTLKDTLIQGDEIEIEIPERKVSYETRERPKANSEVKTEEAPKKSKKDNRNITIFLVIAIIGVLVIGALAFLGIRYYTVPSKIGATETHEVTNPGNVALSVGDVKISAGMYSYYYNQILTSYYSQAEQGQVELDYTKDLADQKTTDEDGKEITWDKKIHDETETWLQQLAAYYSKGAEEKLTVDEETQKSIDDQIASIKSAAEEAKMTVDDYVQDAYGDYVTLATLRNANEWYAIAQQYARKMAIEIHPTDKEASQYFESHKDDFTRIKFAYLPVPYDESNADASIKMAEDYAKSIKTVDDMKKAIPVACKYVIDQYVEYGYYPNAEKAAEDIAKNVETSVEADDTSMFTQDILDWLFSEDTKVGTCKAFNLENYQAMIIALKTEEPSLLDDTVYSVRHILIMPGSDAEQSEDEEAEAPDPTKATKEQWAAAEKQANDVLAEFEKGDKSEYSFALLAEKYTTDTASVSAGGQGGFGGLYQNTPLGQMVPAFENWATDKERKYGDTGIVKSDYGYHIMYFVDAGPEYLANSKLYLSMEEEDKFIDSYPIKRHTRVIDRVSAAVNASVKKMVEDAVAQQNAANATDDAEDAVVDDADIVEEPDANGEAGEDFEDEESIVVEGD